MEKLTRAELEWLAEAAKLTAGYYEQRGRRAKNSIERGLASLRSEQLQSIAGKLGDALAHGDKRIEIK